MDSIVCSIARSWRSVSRASVPRGLTVSPTTDGELAWARLSWGGAAGSSLGGRRAVGGRTIGRTGEDSCMCDGRLKSHEAGAHSGPRAAAVVPLAQTSALPQPEGTTADEEASRAPRIHSQRTVTAMLLQQYFTKDKDSIRYYVENLTTQTLFWSVYRKKVVVFGDAPVERATDPVVVLPGETGILPKPAIKLPWKRYIAFSHDAALLTEHPTAKEFEGLLNIWTDELNGVVLTEYTAPDGVQCVKVSSWAAWNAKKRMAPASAKMHSVHDHFLHEMHTKLIHGLPPHKYQTTVARIRTGSQLCAGEQEFNAMRGAVVKEAIGKLTGLDVSAFSETNVPRISICASGGGYRAMIATLGSLIGLEECGILDCVTNMSGLSGSTWMMSQWYASGLSLRETRSSLAGKLSSRPFYTQKLWPGTIKAHVRERVGFHQELGLVDVMGWHLHEHLNKDLPVKEEHWNHPRLSEQAERIADGSRPMPIYTAVAHEHARFRWCEFTPFEIGFAQDIQSFVPSWAFGRRFTQGVSTDFAVEPSLSLLQGCWGSAFCATVDQMMHEVQAADGKPEPTVQKLLHSLIYEKLEMQEDRLISPAKFPNPALSAAHLGSEHPWSRMQTLKLMDAGVHTNLPFPPLLRKERETDLILAFDQSSSPDILSSVSISVAESFARAEGLPFPDCSEALAPMEGSTEKRRLTQCNAQKCTVIRGDLSKGVPWIIYMPLLKCDLYSKDFCPRANGACPAKDGGFCSTFNFKYTEENVQQLSGLTEHNVKESLKTIKAVIAEITQERLKLNQQKASGLAPATGSNGKQ